MKQKCSICKSSNLIPYNHIIKNRYTEEFSTILKLSEENLEREYSNLICRNCSFIFKKKWFNKTILRKIYNKIVNSHPRGWDVISNKLNLNYFNKQVVLLENLLNKNANVLKLNHIKRIY